MVVFLISVVHPEETGSPRMKPALHAGVDLVLGRVLWAPRRLFPKVHFLCLNSHLSFPKKQYRKNDHLDVVLPRGRRRKFPRLGHAAGTNCCGTSRTYRASWGSRAGGTTGNALLLNPYFQNVSLNYKKRVAEHWTQEGAGLCGSLGLYPGGEGNRCVLVVITRRPWFF